MNSLLTFAPLLARRSAGAVGTLLLGLVGTAAGIALLGVSGWFLTGAALSTAAATFNLFGPSSLVRAFSFIRIGARYGEKLIGHDLTLGVLADIRGWLFARLIPRVPLVGSVWRHGDLVSRLVTDVEALDTIVIAAVGPMLSMLAAGLLLGVGLALTIPAAAILYGAAFSSAGLIVPAGLVIRSRRLGERLVNHKAQLRIAVLDGIEGHADLVTFHRSRDAQDRMTVLAERLSSDRHRQDRMAAGAGAAVLFIAGTTAVGVLLLGIDGLRSGAVGGPVLVGLVLAVLASFETVALVVRNAGRLGAALASADRLKALAEKPAAVTDAPRPAVLTTGRDLRFENVWFSHRPERALLRGINLVCEAGSRTAVVGESGSGKSTLLDLAVRLIDPDKGCIRVAGRRVADVAQAELHARIALMGQATPVFLGTIADNLRLAREDATDDDLRDALRCAGLDTFVAGLPDGLRTWCGEGGRTLSVGQARRLCLARILLTRADILLLDEPTSGLDRPSERAFFETLAQATAGRTVLLVTHAALPPGTVERIFRLAEGRLTLLPGHEPYNASRLDRPSSCVGFRACLDTSLPRTSDRVV